MAKHKVISVKTMRESDAYTIEHYVSSKELMRRAGIAIYENVDWQDPVGIVCGSGNNAGDGYVVADLLKKSGIDCKIILLSGERFSEDGSYYFEICKKHEIPYEIYSDKTDLSNFNTILDCILGTGFSGDVRGVTADAINAINSSGAYVVSTDINSGLNGDTGEGVTYVKSDLTISIGTFKHGHFRGLSSEAMKSKINCDIGIRIHGAYEYVEEID